MEDKQKTKRWRIHRGWFEDGLKINKRQIDGGYIGDGSRMD